MATINAIGSNKPIEVSFGGTNNNSVTQNALAVGGSDKIEYLTLGTDSTVLVGNTGSQPTWTSDLTISSLTLTGLSEGVVQSNSSGSLTSNKGTDGQLLIGSSSGAPAWANLTSTSGDIIITNGPNSIDLAVSSSGSGNEFEDSLFRIYDNVDNSKKIAFEASGITTSTIRTITMCDQDLDLTSPSFPGNVTAGTGLTVSSGGIAVTSGNLTMSSGNISITSGDITLSNGDITVSSGQISLPATTSSVGNILIDSERFIHAYGTDNTFIGLSSGNYTLTGTNNTAVGSSSLSSVTSGSYNITVGYNSGSSYTSSESSNICIGNNGTALDSNTIRIGTNGTGNGQQDTCYIAGIYDATPSGSTQETVIIDSNHQLGSTSYVTGDIPINAQTGTTYTLVLSDRNKMITLDNSASITVTVPANSSVAFPTGTQILLYQKGAGQVTVAGDTGVTVNSSDSELKTYGQYAVIGLLKLDTDTWVVVGDKAS